jgi:hypothetical protein
MTPNPGGRRWPCPLDHSDSRGNPFLNFFGVGDRPDGGGKERNKKGERNV